MQTLAYMLPILSQAIQRGEAELQRLAAERRQHMAGTLQAVVVAPSRELAMQIVRVGQSLLPPEARGCVQQAIGGANPYRQVWPLGLSLELQRDKEGGEGLAGLGTMPKQPVVLGPGLRMQGGFR